MYIKKIVVKNIGPIDELAVEFPFNQNGSPKPVIFVGENGSGKTILQSQIIDALYEIGSSLFDDIGVQQGLWRSYYKVSGGLNLKTGAEKGFSLLQFTNDYNQSIEYYDKIWDVQKSDFTKYINNFQLSPKGKSNNEKEITNVWSKKEVLQQEWIQGVHFYQPAYRYEEPFWKNDPFVDHVRFEDTKRFANELGKELEIVTAIKENKTFLLDLVLDYEVQKQLLDRITWDNINLLLKKVKKREDIRFGIGPRGRYRVSIVELDEKGNPTKQLLPSIDNLSLGESILLNLFINIIRHGDHPPKTTAQIQGIVAIDEIDVHLHTDLQNTVLPELIKLFPKIQFIITTHSPLFLLGMEKTFGEENFEIRNMPTGELITTERFSDFEYAYTALKETEKFENDVKTKIKENQKPILLLEWPTDKKIFEKAWEVFYWEEDFPYLIMDLESGHNAKDVKFELEKADAFQNKCVIGIFDFDEEWYNQWNGLRFKTEIENQKKKHQDKNYYGLLLPCLAEINIKGLESQIKTADWKSLEEKTIFEVEHMFYSNISTDNQNKYFESKSIYGWIIWRIKKNKKNDFCDWICANGIKEDFKNFEKIFDIIADIITSNENQS